MGLFKIQRIRFYLIAGVVLLFAGQVIGAPVAIIDQPLKDARITSLPQQVRFHFTEPVNPATVSVKVNGKAQENKFRLTSTSGVGSLGVTEGLRPSLGSRGQLFAPNVIHVQARTVSGTAVNAVATFFVMAPAENAAVVKKTISSTGGALDLSNYAIVEFAPNSFSDSQLVSVAATATAETGLDWDTTVQIFGQAFRTSYEIRVNTGAQAPAQPTVFRMVVPPDFVAAGPVDGEVKLFAQVLEDGGQGILDSFEIFDSTLIDGVLTGSLPPQVFTNRRRTDATYEAVVIVGMLRTKPVVSSASMTAAKIGLAEVSVPNSPDARLGRWPVENQLVASMAAISGGDCKGGKLGSPLDNRVVTSPFNPGAKHYGVDYGATDGTPVKAMADGVIERIGFDARPLPTPDPRSGKMIKGWGRYVVLLHGDGSRTLYAHLQENGVTVTEGSNVAQGTALGGSNNSGGSSAPHLHVEYAPNGKIYERSSKADAEACIDLVSGSISIRDNGSIADDAFSLYINGAKVCSTTIGAANTCAVGSLRPGTVQLTLVCDVAPDNVGTYELSVGSGLKFSDGSLVRSGALQQGGSATFDVSVP